MKLQNNLSLQFSPIFMTPGTWKFTNLEASYSRTIFRDFFEFEQAIFSNLHVHETSLKSGTSNFSNLHGNSQKSEASYSRTIFKDFLEFEQAISPDWQKEAIAESFTKIRPQKAKLWPQNGIPLVAKKWNNQKIESNISPDWQN